MNYAHILSACREGEHLISMVSVEGIVRLGVDLGLNENCRVLDLGCGYGTMLKLWSEAFGLRGIGIDRDAEFIQKGTARLTNDRVDLRVGDLLAFDDNAAYDVVICTELSFSSDGNDTPFPDLAAGIGFLQRFCKPGGKVVFGRLFSKIPAPPAELVAFDGELPTLGELHRQITGCGYYITAMATDTPAEWERYITWSAKRDLARLRKDPNDRVLAEWMDTWYRIYFDYRRPYEGWGLFGVERL